jgi:arylsulfatase A-like enzyme
MAAAQPNILVILTDDHRGGVNPRVMPKTVEWLKAGGREFPNAITVSPTCASSRASTMTGLHVHNHAVWTNRHGRNLPQHATMQRHLQGAGYRTALVGKFINAWKSDSDVLLKPDPLYWNDFSFAIGSGCMYPQHRCKQPDRWKRYNVNGAIKTIDRYPTAYIADRFSKFVDAGPQPWYAYLCPPNPHQPYGIQKRFEGAPVGNWNGNLATEEDTLQEKRDKPPYIRESDHTLAQGKRMRANQLRSLMSVDVMVDSILNKLQSNGQLDNTLIFLLSDNGTLWSEHTWLRKRVPYDQAIRIPFFVRGPGFDPGTSSQKLVANIDVAPTVYRAAGIEGPAAIDGRALQDDFDRGHIFCRYFKDTRKVSSWASIVTAEAKYTEYYRDGGMEPPMVGAVDFTEYYDRSLDPWELRNGKEPPPNKPFAAQLAIDRSSSPPVPDNAI